MFKFLFTLCLAALTLGAGQLLWLHQDTPLTLELIWHTPTLRYWCLTFLATPTFCVMYAVVKGIGNLRHASRLHRGRRSTYLHRQRRQAA